MEKESYVYLSYIYILFGMRPILTLNSWFSHLSFLSNWDYMCVTSQKSRYRGKIIQVCVALKQALVIYSLQAKHSSYLFYKMRVYCKVLLEHSPIHSFHAATADSCSYNYSRDSLTYRIQVLTFHFEIIVFIHCVCKTHRQIYLQISLLWSS